MQKAAGLHWRNLEAAEAARLQAPALPKAPEGLEGGSFKRVPLRVLWGSFKGVP